MRVPQTNRAAKLWRPQKSPPNPNRTPCPMPGRRARCRRVLRPRRTKRNRRQMHGCPTPKLQRPNHRRGAVRLCASRRRKYIVTMKVLPRHPSRLPYLRSSPSYRVRRRARPVIVRAVPVGGASVCSGRANRVRASIRARPSASRPHAPTACGRMTGTRR
jgi:hypothetical protein